MSDCIECGRELFARCDKKFSHDGCLIPYKNRIHKKGTEDTRRINRLLEKNRRILEKMIISGKRQCSIMNLLGEGYNFGYSTSFEIRKDGKRVIHCYNYSYIISSKDIVYVALKNI